MGILSKNPHNCTNHNYDHHILIDIKFSKNSEIVQFLTKIKDGISVFISVLGGLQLVYFIASWAFQGITGLFKWDSYSFGI